MAHFVPDAKKRYRDFCLEEKSIPLFSRDWWLDAACGEENWDVVVIENNNIIIGTMPYYKKTKFGMRILSQPKLTGKLGPWIKPSESSSETKYSTELAKQKDIMEMFIQQLPKYSYFTQSWPSSMKNWLPFYWKGFQQTTRYSYILEDISNLEKIWDDLQENIRRDIRKASNRFLLRVRHDLSIDDLLTLNRSIFEHQGKKVPYEDEFFKRLDAACQKQNCGQILIAEDEEGRHHAGYYIIWDENSAHGLIGGGNPALRNSGATSLCMWEAIRHASTVTQKFDFEGSMIEPIERFFRAFGAVQTPYFQISRTPSRFIRTVEFLRSLKNS